MRAQLARLLEVAELPNVAVQVVPFDAGENPGLDGGMTLLSFTEGPDIGYTEVHGGSSVLVESPEAMTRCVWAFNLIRATALPLKASAAAIQAAMDVL